MTDTQFHPDDSCDLRRPAEESTAAGEAKPQGPLLSVEAKRLVHELEVHQVELEMQNEELRARRVKSMLCGHDTSTCTTWPRWAISRSANKASSWKPILPPAPC